MADWNRPRKLISWNSLCWAHITRICQSHWMTTAHQLLVHLLLFDKNTPCTLPFSECLFWIIENGSSRSYYQYTWNLARMFSHNHTRKGEKDRRHKVNVIWKHSESHNSFRFVLIFFSEIVCFRPTKAPLKFNLRSTFVKKSDQFLKSIPNERVSVVFHHHHWLCKTFIRNGMAEEVNKVEWN